MWILFWTKYQASKFATFVSIVGALMRYAGVLCLFAGAPIGTVVCFGIGVGIHFLAEAIGFGGWKKMVHKKGLDEKVKQGDVPTAVSLYNGDPKKRTLNYIESLNAQVAAQIRAQIEKK